MIERKTVDAERDGQIAGVEYPANKTALFQPGLSEQALQQRARPGTQARLIVFFGQAGGRISTICLSV